MPTSVTRTAPAGAAVRRPARQHERFVAGRRSQPVGLTGIDHPTVGAAGHAERRRHRRDRAVEEQRVAEPAAVEREELGALVRRRALDARPHGVEQRAVRGARSERAEGVEQRQRERPAGRPADGVLLGLLVRSAGGQRDVGRRRCRATASRAPGTKSSSGRGVGHLGHEVARCGVDGRTQPRTAESTVAGRRRRSGSSRGRRRRGHRRRRPRRAARRAPCRPAPGAACRRCADCSRGTSASGCDPVGSRSAISGGRRLLAAVPGVGEQRDVPGSGSAEVLDGTWR